MIRMKMGAFCISKGVQAIKGENKDQCVVSRWPTDRLLTTPTGGRYLCGSYASFPHDHPLRFTLRLHAIWEQSICTLDTTAAC